MTLEKLEGMCTNKATLQIALCRAIGIPAGYSIVHIKRGECGWLSGHQVGLL